MTRASKREWIGLAVLSLGTLAVSFDVFVLLLALPRLSTDLGATGTQQLWIMDIYGFVLGGLLITMGGIGDRIGRRRLLLIGAVAFAVASIVAAYSTSPEMLIAARAVLGIAGATLAPSTLSLISNMFRDPKQMGLAIGIWGATFTVGAIIGPMVGGLMLAHFWWGSVFLLAVPAMVLLVLLGPVLLPEYRAAEVGRLDLASVALSMAAILPVIYGIKEIARHGWQLVPAVAVVTGLAFGVAFVVRQRRIPNALLDVRLFSNNAFTVPLVSMLAVASLSGTTMLFIAQHFQLVDGLTPVQAALGLLPGMATGTVSMMVAPLLGRRFRPAYLISSGLVISIIGFAVMIVGSGPAALVIAFAISASGAGPLLSLGINLVVSSAPPEKAGTVSAMPQISNEMGYALGIAVVGTVGTLVYRMRFADSAPAGLPADTARTAGESITGATTAAADLPGQLGVELLTAARDAYTSGLRTVAGITAVALAGIIVLIATKLRHLPPTGAEAAAEAPADQPVEDEIARPDAA